MRVIGTLLVRNEEEIVRECIEHHLKHGVDGFIVTDNGSKDNTRKILEDCPGILRIIDEPTHNHHQAKWVTRMAREAHRLGAYWAVHIDADEFWHGLHHLQNVNKYKGVGVINVMNEYVHVPVAGLEFGKFRRDQMPYYKRIPRPMPKVIHRAVSTAHVTHGNHSVLSVPGRHIVASNEIHIHHYSIRSFGHFAAKVIQGGKALQKHPGPTAHGKRWRQWYQQYKQGKLEQLYLDRVYSQEKIEERMREGKLKSYIPKEYLCPPNPES